MRGIVDVDAAVLMRYQFERKFVNARAPGQRHLFIVGKPCQQFVRPRPEVGALPGGQRRCMAFELFDTEELRTKQLGICILAPIVTTEYDLRKLFESDDGLLIKQCCRPRAPITAAAAAE